MNYPNFSVSICVYGGDSPMWFEKVMEGLYTQTLIPSEIVLVVDGPISSVLNDVIGKYESDSRVEMRVIRLEMNRGHGNARRIGIANCRYDYIAIADADDINRADRFEKQMECFVRNPELSLVGIRNSIFWDTEDNIVTYSNRPETHQEIVSLMKKECPITQSGVIFSKAIYKKSGGYEDHYCAEDYFLWVKMYENGAKFYNCQEPLQAVNSSIGQMKRRGGWRYFKSTSSVSIYMYKKGIISFSRMAMNIAPRFVMQVLMLPSVRAKIRIFLIKQRTKKLGER